VSSQLPDNSHKRTTVFGRHERQVVCSEWLIPRGRHLQRRRQIDPHLDRMDEAPFLVEPFGREFVVEDATPSRHPLGVAVTDDTATTV
jgi:hypothetical protein